MKTVYQKIAAVTAELHKIGISKGRKNQQQGYAFRGIDDIYNALSGVLSAHGLCILPRYQTRAVVERATAKGGALFYVTLDGEMDFVSADDGSTHTVRVFGEAMDSADKATNKAMSAAYKYACLQVFLRLAVSAVKSLPLLPVPVFADMPPNFAMMRMLILLPPFF